MIEREDQYRFTVAPVEPVDNMSLTVTCERCGLPVTVGGLALLADLNDAATEHAEVCR